MNLSDYFDKIYFINLDEDTNKRIYFEKEISKSTLAKKCKKYTAVIGKYLDIRLVPSEIITESAKQDVIQRKQKVYGISLTYGSLACALSHYFIYKECSGANKPYLIFEDDIIIDNKFDSDLSQVINHITDKDYDIVYLGYNEIGGFAKTKINDVLSEPRGLITGLYGYIVSPSGAEKLLKSVFPLNKQIDSSISDNSELFSLYCSTKNIVRVKTDFGSKTQMSASCANEYNHSGFINNRSDGWEKLFQ
jgi:glycosyl transferase family 25